MAVTLVVWQVLVASGSVKAIVLPSLSSVGVALRSLLSSPSGVLSPVGRTLGEAGAAFGLAVAIGLPTGLVVGRSRLLLEAYEPLLASANALPIVILYPVLAATLGVGTESKIALGVLYGFFPVAITTARAVSQVDGNLLSAATAMGAGRVRALWTVVLPAVAQQVITGLRVALGLTLVTVIAGEFIAGEAGLGYQLAATSQSLDTPGLFAWVVISVALTVLVSALFNTIALGLQKGFER